MTKISITSASPTDNIEIAKFLHQRFKMSLIGSQKKLAMGDKGFFYTCDLYGNDHVQREKDLREIIDFFNTKSCPLFLLEIEDDQEWGDLDAANLSQHSISEEELLNALNSSMGLYE
ncbi:hypothetical protein [Pseudomonas syringae]|uniref:Uncharacterized protein n=3 Tax=Pseudomonas syringae TaxID=317 RepID=A0A656JJ83_PSESF|nr:hypothetical protein [Pseudomonas syringae]EPN30346.1 hypothetical protein A245_45713 [Pseudomonas syringae pv. actinidiae ICMP 19096]EPM43196.1 hypothetical protein A246_27939 [Pseudomonas syringae pv. actinidiae ICMP 19098]EPM67609.1 hypothetical protein A249_40070 [Pseudomonas syringae pv. actinidiae ICMP 18804]EPN13946.1 hypothetical protein A248_28541 [Pseudomonas syringae pv. actinidiae ICMP 19100]EPN29495.1 hypothetical protein A247_00665 [Pseudomonas syringae pv. actinidiae ICMP 190